MRQAVLGAYYPYNPRTPVHGLGAEELPQVSFADEIARELLNGAVPFGAYVPWAQQVSDTSWQEVPSEWTFTCIPISNSLLGQVANLSGGHEVPYVAIVTDRPATLNAIERAFFGTPYKLDSSQAMYPASYNGASEPKITFVIFGKLRELEPGDGAGGGSSSMDSAAAALGGKLVYAIQGLPPSPANRPTMAFASVLAAQLGQTQVPTSKVIPGTVTVAPIQTPAVAPQPADNRWLLLLLGAAAAAGIWWYVAKNKKGRASEASA